MTKLTALRRDSAHPELGFEEVRTGHCRRRAGSAGHRGCIAASAKTGMVGIIRGRTCDSGRMITACDADMDALPMTEDNNFGHKSTKPGLMAMVAAMTAKVQRC